MGTEEIKGYILPSFKEMEEQGRKELMEQIELLRITTQEDSPKVYTKTLTKMFEDNVAILIMVNEKFQTHEERIGFLKKFLVDLGNDIAKLVKHMEDHEWMIKE
jgi:hypothetical protein